MGHFIPTNYSWLIKCKQIIWSESIWEVVGLPLSVWWLLSSRQFFTHAEGMTLHVSWKHYCVNSAAQSGKDQKTEKFLCIALCLVVALSVTDWSKLGVEFSESGMFLVTSSLYQLVAAASFQCLSSERHGFILCVTDVVNCCLPCVRC